MYMDLEVDKSQHPLENTNSLEHMDRLLLETV